MYLAIVTDGKKRRSSIQLDVSSADEVASPRYAGNYSEIKKLIETSYSHFGHQISTTYSVDELEFVLNQNKFKLKVLKDVQRGQFYQTESLDIYS